MCAFSVIVALAGTGMPPLVIVWLGTLVAVPVCMLVGFIVERAAYKPLRHAPRLAPLITAIGVSIILQHLALLVWSRNIIAFPQIIELKLFHLGDSDASAAISNVQIVIILTSIAMMAGLLALVYRTKLGTAMRALADDREVTAMLGVPVRRVEAAAWFGSGLACGAAGLLLPDLLTSLDYSALTFLVISSLAAALIGRLRSLGATLAGGLAVGVAQAILSPYTSVSAYRSAAPFVLAIVALLYLSRHRVVTVSRAAG